MVKNLPNQNTKSIKSSNKQQVNTKVNFQMNKGLGQHLLSNQAIVNQIVTKSGVTAEDIVLEIGPGSGVITLPLLQKCKKLIAVEFDPRMQAEILKSVKAAGLLHKFELIRGDFLKVAQLPKFDKCVANVPYQISSGIVFKLLQTRPLFKSATLMFQREFCLRLTATAGSEHQSRISCNTQILAKVEHLFKVAKQNFTPPPKVESSVVKITPHNPPIDIDQSEWDAMTNILFNHKNKTIRSILKLKATYEKLQKSQNLNNKDQNNNASEMEDEIKNAKDGDSSDQKGFDYELEKLCAKFDKRPFKMDDSDLLSFMLEMNKHGIFFKA